MPIEPATLRTRRGEQGAARADVIRYGAARRYGAAGGSLLFGLALGMATLPFPLIHFVLPWLLPVFGLIGALAILRVRGRIAAVSGACPGCGAAVQATDPGTSDGEPVWLKCPGCGSPLELIL
jgi:hypothetical protein